MRKLFMFLTTVAVAFLVTSCSIMRSKPVSLIPKAINTVNSVSLQELNLRHGTDYKVMKEVKASAVVSYRVSGKTTIIQEENNEFTLRFTPDKDGNVVITCDGVVRYGFLNNDYTTVQLSDSPEYVARNLAIYRLINAVKAAGADGVIEPLISSSIEQKGRDIIIKTVAQAKLVRLVTDK